MTESIYFGLLNFLLLLAVIAFAAMFCMTVVLGKVMMRDIRSSCSLCQQEVKEYHRWYADSALLSLALAVLLVEIQVRLGGFEDRTPELFWTHLFFAIPFLCTLLALRFKITGTKNLLLHKKIAYLSIALFIGTAITGGLLFWGR